MLEEVADEKSPLPDVEETRRRLSSGQDLIGRLTVAEWLDLWLASKRVRRSSSTGTRPTSVCTSSRIIGKRRLDRLRVSHLTDMFTAISDANAEIAEQNAQRRAAVDELATVPWKGAENRARRKAMKAAIDGMPRLPPHHRPGHPPAHPRHPARRAERRDRAADHHLQPGRARRAGPGTQAEGAGVDR